MEQAQAVFDRRGYFATIFHLLRMGLDVRSAEDIANALRLKKIEELEAVHFEAAVV